ncbi:hypothetical protein [Nocardia xishanensis]|uniref:hypothetical protein n=1 Tax=Nocardia xishanensis TaxID=238964 RepID=UPI000830FE67|nr:hypothetical protein [Nocardia xishanensis]
MTRADDDSSDGDDVHIQVDLQGVILHYAAQAAAALRLMHDDQMRRYLNSVILIPGDATGLRRLPCEALYLGP